MQVNMKKGTYHCISCYIPNKYLAKKKKGYLINISWMNEKWIEMKNIVHMLELLMIRLLGLVTDQMWLVTEKEVKDDTKSHF